MNTGSVMQIVRYQRLIGLVPSGGSFSIRTNWGQALSTMGRSLRKFVEIYGLHIRKNAWNNSGTFNNSDLLWYAQAVGAMQARSLDDTSSWWFFAAIHGEYILKQGGPAWNSLPSPPQVPTTPLPTAAVSDLYWDQCQHGSWYFGPWHRGYLWALEAQVRTDVIKLGGPASWALPYWDYFGAGSEFNIPPAFTQQNLPDGSANPLYVAARYGPDGNGNIFVLTPTEESNGPVTEQCLTNDVYTGEDANTRSPGFGGPNTGFSHSANTYGNLESNPHNFVHVEVGGSSGPVQGLMSVPGTAALDPIFYLHHANIDRMWAGWNQNPANTNPTDPNWLNGPAAIGEAEFVMPMPYGSSWVYTPQQMSSLSQLNYQYDSLPPLPPPPTDLVVQRLARLRGATVAAQAQGGLHVTTGENKELVGASQGPVSIKSSGASVAVLFDSTARGKVAASLATASETALPDRVFLNLENVIGKFDAAELSLYINLPGGAKPGDHPELLAGTVALFGLGAASAPNGKHAGQGLNFALEITSIIDTLYLSRALDVDSLKVTIVPARRALPDRVEITVGRVSIHRQGA